MSEALEAIEDIKQALNDYGTDILLGKVTKGVYDPVAGEEPVSTSQIPIKAFVGSYSSQELMNPDIRATDKKFTLYYADGITYDDKIIFEGKIHHIVNIDPQILQNETLKFVIQSRV